MSIKHLIANKIFALSMTFVQQEINALFNFERSTVTSALSRDQARISFY